ncbi:MAG: hypothetical protein HQ582_03930 [Planctomycetes bacterium]|nr:hypothetical protein [Planctomycetota bacterium]
MMMDFGIMSILLVAAHLARSRLKLLQDFFVPTPIIAGFVGLFLGEQFLDVLPFSRLESGECAIRGYASWLVVLVFASLFMGHRKKRPSVGAALRSAGDTAFYSVAAYAGMFGFALLFGVLALQRLFPELHPGFAVLLPTGFVGGHGTAAAVADVMESGPNRLTDALSIGNTFATVGLLVGIGGGMLLVNIATRRGWTRLVKSAQELPESVRRGFLSEEERRPLGRETVSPIALDPLTWHVGLLLVAFAVSYLIRDGVEASLPGVHGIPVFAVALLVGGGIQALLNLVGAGQYVDRRTMERIGSSASDYLIAFGVASIKIAVVVEFAVPIAVLSVFGIAFAAMLFWFVGRRIYHDFWCERSIFAFGWNTGVVAIGIALLRVVDPRLKSKTLEDFGLGYALLVSVEIPLLVIVPALALKGVILAPALVLIALSLACLVASACIVGWFREPADALREGEAKTIAEDASPTASP